MTDTWRSLKPILRDGYPTVNLSRSGTKAARRIHRLVLEAFVGPCPEGMVACHNDGSRTNNDLANLRFDSNREAEAPGGDTMPEPVIRLPNMTRLGRQVLGDCRWKIRTFFERDAYVEYDYKGGLANPSLDVITETQVHAMNCAMRARSPNAAWSRFIGQPLSELRHIDETLDLVDGADADVRVWEALASSKRPNDQAEDRSGLDY